jgi:DNA-binding PucR family transcriptional regulator
MCLLIKILETEAIIDRSWLLLHTEQTVRQHGIGHYICGWLHGDMILVLENKNHLSENQFNAGAVKLSQELAASISEHHSGLKYSIGIGKHHIGSHQISRSFTEALKAINLGNSLESGKRMYSFIEMEAFSLLQYSPLEVLEEFVSSCLSPLLEHDQTHSTELVHTLDVFLHSLLRPAETARVLGIHRNTVHFRLKCIKEILENELNDSAYLFKLQLALHAMRLLKKT